MSNRLARAITLTTVVTAVIAGCTELPRLTAPESLPRGTSAVRPAGDLVGGVTGTVTGTVAYTVQMVNRTVPLSQDVTWSFLATPGGTISTNSQVGLTIRFPAGAVSQPTLVTVTAKAGAVLDYQFQPHGIQFAKSVTLTQDLTLTSVAGNVLGAALRGAYYASDQLQYDGSTNTATVNELEPTTVTVLPASVSWNIRHFSGYVVASCANDQ